MEAKIWIFIEHCHIVFPSQRRLYLEFFAFDAKLHEVIHKGRAADGALHIGVQVCDQRTQLLWVHFQVKDPLGDFSKLTGS